MPFVSKHFNFENIFVNLHCLYFINFLYSTYNSNSLVLLHLFFIRNIILLNMAVWHNLCVTHVFSVNSFSIDFGAFDSFFPSKFVEKPGMQLFFPYV